MSFIPTDKKLQYYSTLIAFIATIVTSYIAIDTHYAKAQEVKNIELRLDQKIIGDRSDQIQNRMWKIEEKYPEVDKGKAPNLIRSQWKSLNDELNKNNIILNKTLDKINK